MKITESTVKKITITNVQNLDPVSVMVEDFGQGEGKITITCFGEAWSHYWRREGDISKETARERWDSNELLYEVFGDEYWYCTPKKPNPEYQYLCRIIKTVQAGLRELEAAHA